MHKGRSKAVEVRVNQHEKPCTAEVEADSNLTSVGAVAGKTGAEEVDHLCTVHSSILLA